MTQTDKKPIHLSGAHCGDWVYQNGARIGVMYHWTEGGVSVQLLSRVATVNGWMADHVVITDEMFWSGEYSWERWSEEYSWERRQE